MRQGWIARSLILSQILFVGMLGGKPERSLAQSLPTCDPPRPDEYLLLVRNPNAETQNQLRQLLPGNAVLTDCRYDNNPVVRVEGFVSAEIANAWAQYLSSSAGLEAIVARPPANNAATTNFPSPTQPPPSQVTTPATPTPSNPAAATPPANPAAVSPTPTPAPQTSAQPTTAQPTPAFNPQPLGAGYAVVVNYFNRPEVALDVQQVTSRDVGLVAFEQRPYLLAAHTPDPAAASAVLKSLTDRGFVASIVDSRRIILLTPAVAR